jgi:hypothetical protein
MCSTEIGLKSAIASRGPKLHDASLVSRHQQYGLEFQTPSLGVQRSEWLEIFQFPQGYCVSI